MCEIKQKRITIRRRPIKTCLKAHLTFISYLYREKPPIRNFKKINKMLKKKVVTSPRRAMHLISLADIRNPTTARVSVHGYISPKMSQITLLSCAYPGL